jgi:hypothetical protein
MRISSLRRIGQLIAAAAVAGAMATAADAGSMAYTVSGVADGTLGTANFVGFTFSVTASGDASVVDAVAPGVLCVDAKDATFRIDGFATGTITSPLSVAENAGWKLVAITRGRCADDGPMWTNGSNARFGSYDLTSKLEPVALSMPSAAADVVVQTSAGALALRNVSALTFKAQSPAKAQAPAAAAALAPVDAVTTVPTLDAWGLGLLATMLAGVGTVAARRRTGPRAITTCR